MLKWLILAPVLLVVPPAHANEVPCSSLFAGEQPPALLNAKLTARTAVLCNQAYASLASGITRGPLWSAEHLTATAVRAARQIPREGEFQADDRLPAQDQAQLADYRRSGYDRGHMTPAGDMPDAGAQQQSFLLSNIVPQVAELNRGLWEKIESAIRDLAVQEGDLYVVTGPAFQGEQLQSIGSGVLVPTSTWKAVYDPKARGTGVYVCGNTERPTCDTAPVSFLIEAVGIDPFPALPDSLKRRAMTLPLPGESRYPSHQRSGEQHGKEGLVDWLLSRLFRWLHF